MVFGFGFNKTKVLASAEKSVKQGKLQNAIADYEKILAEDPKDLTVMNTVGDLYARVGNIEKATEYFRKIGNSYASEGFTVRAIAMYKKLTKQNPGALDAVLKLGELYTQQGLHNDARAQFMLVAEHNLRNNELQQAATVLQKTLELDPENSSLQARLAELYVKIGRAADARDLYFRNAESLHARGALDLADDALGHVINLDPNFSAAIMLRGQVKFDSGDPESAIALLEQLPDLDSRPEALRTLLKAKLAFGDVESAGPIARKLLTVFNDSTGIAGFGEALMAAGSYEQALELFTEHASVMLSANQPGFTQALQALTGRLKTSTKALEQLSVIFQRTGNTGQVVEVTELLAHACVQEGNLTKARDLYQRLTALEPENPQHAQNYRQIVSRLTEHLPPSPKVESTEPDPEPQPDVQGSTTSAEEIMPASLVEQNYPGDLAELVEAALTDADLFDSYNLAPKAIAPLEIILSRVPNDVRVNQRLASLYARSGRLKEAAERFNVLERIHVEAGYLKDSRHYAELATKYSQRAGVPLAPQTPAATPAGPQPALPSPSVERTAERPVVPEPAVSAQMPPAPASAAPTPATVVPEPVLESQSHEIDLSDEWEQMLKVEHPEPPPPVVPAAPPISVQPVAAQPEQSTSAWDSLDEEAADPIGELLDETRFYIAQSMWPEAEAAIARCEAIAPRNPELALIKAQLPAQNAPATPEPAPAEFELISNESSSDLLIEDVEQVPAVDPLLMSETSEPVAATPALPAPPVLAPPPAPIVAPPEPAAPITAVDTTGLWEVAESDVAESTEPAGDDLFGFVHDLEASLGEDFNLEPRSSGVEKPATPALSIGASAPGSHDDAEMRVSSTPDKTAIAASAAASASFAPAPAPAVPSPVMAAATPATEQPSTHQAVDETISEEEERTALSDIFAEFKESMESGSDTEEDPETHYNLGVAFKEMDLFDEAIGEFQKVCQSIERGHSFAQPVQAFTWLADCFLKKGEADLAIRWYERALKTPKIDYEIDTAIRYELACACLAAGDRQTALRHFMEVYGTNIDYRDVAERIKSLRT